MRGIHKLSFILLLLLLLCITGCSTKKDKEVTNTVQNNKPQSDLNNEESKLSEEQYNEILDAYLEYCEEKSNVYENMTMTLTMDADNKPILLVFFGKDNECHLEINTYEDGNVKALQMIKATNVLLRENGILTVQYSEREKFEEEAKAFDLDIDMIQIKNNKINVLAEYNGKYNAESNKENHNCKYKLYCDDNEKNYVIDINDYETERITPIKQCEKEIEKEIKEWFSYIYGDDEHYLDWMSDLSIFDVVVMLQLYPRILDGVDSPLLCSGIPVSSELSEQNLVEFREMIYSLKAEPKYTWKDFWIFETDRLCEQVEYYYKDTYFSPIRVNFLFSDTDISWLTELKAIKKMPFIKEDANIEDLNSDDVCFPDGIYTYLMYIDDGIYYKTEENNYEYIRLIGSYNKCENNINLFENEDNSLKEILGDSEYLVNQFADFVQDIYKDIDNNWICKYLGVSSLEETVGKTVDNVAILTDFYEWVQSDEHQKLFEQEYEKRIKEREWKQAYKEKLQNTSCVTLAYLDKDDIPECILWSEPYMVSKQVNGYRKVTVLSYKEGKVVEFNSIEAGCSTSVSYKERGGIFSVKGVLGLRSSTDWEFVELTDNFKKIGSAWTDNDYSDYYYKVNDKDVNSTEYENYIKSFNLDIKLTEQNWYKSIDEAYNALQSEEKKQRWAKETEELRKNFDYTPFDNKVKERGVENPQRVYDAKKIDDNTIMVTYTTGTVLYYIDSGEYHYDHVELEPPLKDMP